MSVITVSRSAVMTFRDRKRLLNMFCFVASRGRSISAASVRLPAASLYVGGTVGKGMDQGDWRRLSTVEGDLLEGAQRGPAGSLSMATPTTLSKERMQLLRHAPYKLGQPDRPGRKKLMKKL